MSESQDEILKKSVNTITLLVIVIIILLIIIAILLFRKPEEKKAQEKDTVRLSCGTPGTTHFIENNIDVTSLINANCKACHDFAKVVVARSFTEIIDKLPEPKLENFISYVQNPSKFHKENRTAHIKEIEKMIEAKGINMMPPMALTKEEITAVYNYIVQPKY